MDIKIEREDILESQIRLSRSLINDSLISSEEETKAKKLVMAYKTIEKSLLILGVNPQDFSENKK